MRTDDRNSKSRSLGRVGVSRTKIAFVIAAVLFALAPVGAAGAASNSKATIVVGSVDATGDQTVVDGWVTGADVSDIKMTVAGKKITPASATLNREAGRKSEVVVVLDNGASLGNAPVQLAKRAIEPLMPAAGVADSMAVVTTGDGATVEQGLTSSAGRVSAALGNVGPNGSSATWDGVTRAAQMLSDRGDAVDGTVVLFAGSPSTAAGGGSAAATSALRKAGVDLQVVALSAGVDIGALSAMVDDVGGTLRQAETDEKLADEMAAVADTIGGRFRFVYSDSATDTKVTPFTMKAGDASVSLSYVPGALRVGATALAAPSALGGGISGLFANSAVKWLIVLLGMTAAVMLFWAVVALILPDETNLVQRLEVYEDPYGEKPEPDYQVDEGHATVPIIRRAVDLTGEIGDRRGVTDKLDIRLEQANLPLRAAEAMFFLAITTILVAGLALAITRNLIVAVIVGALMVVVPRAWLNIRIRRNQKRFVNQLPDMLTLLAGTLRAGYSISQGFESVSTEIEDPMGRELRRVVTETRLGRSLEESLEAVAQRMDSDDFAWAVMAIRIQREVGGNLAELLLTVADTMVQRERLRRDVSTLTAEGRMSAIIIGFLPPALGVVMYVMNPEYIRELFSPGLGYTLIGLATVSMGIGFAWMKKTVTIEV